MVNWSETAKNDLSNIFTALTTNINQKTGEVYLSEEEAEEYCEKLFLACNNIDALICVTHARYEMHKEHGEYIYEYNPNRRTTWYIIYDIESNDIDVIIRKIISNHTTLRGIF